MKLTTIWQLWRAYTKSGLAKAVNDAKGGTMKNWRTSAAGLVIAIPILCQQAGAYLEGQPVNWVVVFGAIAYAVKSFLGADAAAIREPELPR
mgnify:CR=1 FL=1